MKGVLIGLGADRRSPHGERGLKFLLIHSRVFPLGLSLPSRGAWIEMEIPNSRQMSEIGRSPHGERGLK